MRDHASTSLAGQCHGPHYPLLVELIGETRRRTPRPSGLIHSDWCPSSTLDDMAPLPKENGSSCLIHVSKKGRPDVDRLSPDRVAELVESLRHVISHRAEIVPSQDCLPVSRQQE